MVNLTIDNIKVSVKEGSTILEAAKTAGINIPTLCAWTEIGHTPGACRVCCARWKARGTWWPPVCSRWPKA